MSKMTENSWNKMRHNCIFWSCVKHYKYALDKLFWCTISTPYCSSNIKNNQNKLF
jgi:hypothetical protein